MRTWSEEWNERKMIGKKEDLGTDYWNGRGKREGKKGAPGVRGLE